MRRERRMSIFTVCVGVRVGFPVQFSPGELCRRNSWSFMSSLARGQLVKSVTGLGLERQSVKVSSNCAHNAVR